jgi:hypothetical protein
MVLYQGAGGTNERLGPWRKYGGRSPNFLGLNSRARDSIRRVTSVFSRLHPVCGAMYPPRLVKRLASVRRQEALLKDREIR